MSGWVSGRLFLFRVCLLSFTLNGDRDVRALGFTSTALAPGIAESVSTAEDRVTVLCAMLSSLLGCPLSAVVSRRADKFMTMWLK